LAVGILALLLGLWPDLVGLDPALAPAAALVLLALGLWVTGALPFHLTALLLFFLATVLAVAPPAVVFAGFASSALWLVFGGLVIGNAVQATGLGRRLAGLVAGHVSGSYRRIIHSIVVLSVGLAFLIPAAMGRIVILIPIVAALADQLGFARGRPGRAGMLLAVVLGTVVPAFAILPANLPNMVLLGVAETLYDQRITYVDYLLLHFPVLGLGSMLLLAELICLRLPDQPGSAAGAVVEQTPWSGGELRLLVIVSLALAFWATDWLHGISPGWVALAAAIVCLLPGIGVLDVRAFEADTSFGVFFYVAGLLGMVSIIDASGLAEALGAAALAWLPLDPATPAWNFTALVGLASGLGLITTHPGVPAVLGPLALPMAEASGLSLVAVLMTEVVGFTTILLPYQSAPVMVGLQLAGLGLGPASRLMLLLGLAALVLLVPLAYLWWLWLGYLG
jgi:di/tricarboxylate transporter